MSVSVLFQNHPAHSNLYSHYRQTYNQRMAVQQQTSAFRDDYEKWYTEPNAHNRMVLALRSGIPGEQRWALDRLVRLSENSGFSLVPGKAIPGLVDVLFEYPVWFANGGFRELAQADILFSLSQELKEKRQNAFDALFILRNACEQVVNATALAEHNQAVPLLLQLVSNLDHENDQHVECLLYTIELIQYMSHKFTPHNPHMTPNTAPFSALQRIASTSRDRSLIIASLNTLSSLCSIAANGRHMTANSPAFSASLQYLPLFADIPLVDASLNYMYAHLSHPALAKAFLLDTRMPGVLKLLVTLLLAEQVEEQITVPLPPEVHTVPIYKPELRDHDLTPDELNRLLTLPEPERCHEWMKIMFVTEPDGEVTQVDFWNLYRDTFTPHTDRTPPLIAAEVIKNVSTVYPEAQAMVLQGPTARFIVRGVDRRKDEIPALLYQCKWNRHQCLGGAFENSTRLYEHLIEEHITDEPSQPCLWSTCSVSNIPLARLRSHVLTHFANPNPIEKPSSQCDRITLPSALYAYPNANPTLRPPPPPPQTIISYSEPAGDPPSTSQTALLCIRILFRTSFTTIEAAPRADADHFGFPGAVDDADQEIPDVEDQISDRNAEIRGKKAFGAARHLLEGVSLKDDVLMSWIVEMVEASADE